MTRQIWLLKGELTSISRSKSLNNVYVYVFSATILALTDGTLPDPVSWAAVRTNRTASTTYRTASGRRTASCRPDLATVGDPVWAAVHRRTVPDGSYRTNSGS